jgi:hypothetical protein
MLRVRLDDQDLDRDLDEAPQHVLGLRRSGAAPRRGRGPQRTGHGPTPLRLCRD